ncbi:hypothetical protein [Chloroflexus sp.]|uniref:hypothetical protein n=1 Tax=Chloroflexus sp. TaxID=1904827 RepID=UPI0026089018|nr:hypothetical protein [uncultured Chloroflexus sp.]
MIPRILLIGLLSLLLVSSTVAAQQPSPITISVRVGLDGERSIRPNYWFPVQVTLTNDGPDREIVFEWRDADAERLTQRYRIDLPGGARKQIILPAIQTGRAALAIATSDGVEIWRERISLNQIDAGLLAIGLLSDDPAVLSSLTTADFMDNRRATLLNLEPALLADDPFLLTAFDAIAIRELTADLRPTQRDALLTWVQQGGTLLIGGGTTGETAIRAFADVLPVTVGPLRRDTPINELERLSGLSGLSNFVPTLTANTVTMRPNGQPITRDGLISQVSMGAGKIVFAAFDLAALRAWPGESNVWKAALDLQPRIEPGSTFRFSFNNILQGSLTQSLFSIPSTMTLLGLIGAYIIVIGPLQFLLLRRLRRLEWAWLSTPLLIVIFLGMTYGMSFVVRGGQVQVVQLTIAQSAADGDQAMTTTFTGIFAPQRQSYRLNFPEAAMVTPLDQDTPIATEYDGSSVTIPDLLFDAAAFRTLIIEQVTPNPLDITHQIEQRGNRWEGTLGNASAIRLSDVTVVTGNDAQWLGTLEPGQEVIIDLSTDRDNFINTIQMAGGSLLRRTSILENLFWYGIFNSRFNPALAEAEFPGDGLYLIGWSDQTTPVIQINGEPGQTRGETLYIIALR